MTDEEKSENERESNQREEGYAYRIGDRLNWSAEQTPVKLAVELPNWLLVPNGKLSVTVDDCNLEAQLINNAIEFQQGNKYAPVGNTLYLGEPKGISDSKVSVGYLPEGAVWRKVKTLVVFKTTANSDALKATHEEGVRRSEAALYFAALARGHLAFLNKVANAYRRAVVDPHIIELSEWDVPLWYLLGEQDFYRIVLFPSAIDDNYPTISDGSGQSKEEPYFATSIGDMQVAIDSDVIPGEAEMLDAWGLFFRGRYGDCIRSLVTAVEVLLESQCREALKSAQYSDEQIEKELRITRDAFFNRLTHYSELSGRRVPGPILHWIPWLNGLRLCDEIARTRDLRHEIVHAGKRLDHTMIGPMTRACETTTWFFDWLSKNGDFAKRQSTHYTFFCSGRARAQFDFEICPEGVRVLPLAYPFVDAEKAEEDADLGEKPQVLSPELSKIPENQLLLSLGLVKGFGKDIEHFVRMAFAKLDAHLEDSPYPRRDNTGKSDRYRYYDLDDRQSLVFIFETADKIASSDVDKIFLWLTELKEKGLVAKSSVCVIEDQNGIFWGDRAADSISPEVAVRAQGVDLALIKVEDFFRLVLGANKHNWSAKETLKQVFLPGVAGKTPPNSIHIGNVTHFFTRVNVVEVELNGQTEICKGDTLIYRLRDRFHQEKIQSIQQDNSAILRAKDGKVGIGISLGRFDIPVGADVLLHAGTSSE